MKPDFKAAFREEARDLLADLETALLELDESPTDPENIGRVFRDLHTIKGSGAMFGFNDIASFTHQLENAYDQVREGKVQLSKEMIALTLSAGDHIRSLLENSEGGSPLKREKEEQLFLKLRQLIADQCNCALSFPPGTDDESCPVSVLQKSQAADQATYRIRFRPSADILSSGSNPFLLLDELHSLGTCTITVQTEAIPSIDSLDPQACFTYWDIVLTSRCGIEAIGDVFIFVEDRCELSISEIVLQVPNVDDPDAPKSSSHKMLGEILLERGDLKHDAIDNVLRLQKPIGKLLVESGTVDPGLVESALAEQKHIKKISEERKATEGSSTIRVPAGKIDALVNLVGELVTIQARLSQTALLRNDPEFLMIAEEVERLTGGLRDNTMNMRMLPIGVTFSKFKRLVHDLSAELGKKIILETEGAETELDKTVIERLNDPLVHLIRNSIDHGIEMPEARMAAGKPSQGVVRLSAIHSGANVLIRITDDGAGLDREVIRAKAIEKGLISLDAELSENETYSLIFSPGFSTAKSVTNVSGRGVGMDVVKRSIDALRGSIEVTSLKGAGTTITLKLPLTLAIIDGLLTRLGEDFFVLPLSVVEECVELAAEESAKANGRHILGLRGEIIPYIRLRERFGINGKLPPIEQIVITQSAGMRVGFVVDDVIGEHQTVIKNLSRMYRDVEGISGATILGDGTIALVLDTARLVKQIETTEL